MNRGIKVIDEKGIELDSSIVCAFSIKQTELKYVIYTIGNFDEKNSLIYVSEILDYGKSFSLADIVPEEKWDKVKAIMDDIVRGDVTFEDEYELISLRPLFKKKEFVPSSTKDCRIAQVTLNYYNALFNVGAANNNINEPVTKIEDTPQVEKAKEKEVVQEEPVLKEIVKEEEKIEPTDTLNKILEDNIEDKINSTEEVSNENMQDNVDILFNFSNEILKMIETLQEMATKTRKIASELMSRDEMGKTEMDNKLKQVALMEAQLLSKEQSLIQREIRNNDLNKKLMNLNNMIEAFNKVDN